MSTILTIIRKRPVTTYFILTFAISWGSLFVLSGGTAGFPQSKEQFVAMMPLFIPAVLAGPAAAGILLTVLVDGRAGLKALGGRLIQWRVSWRWYAAALLTGPLVLSAVLLALSLVSPIFLPGIVTSASRASELMFGLIAGLIVGIFEELGWTGFAVPRLRLDHSDVATGLIVGVVWGAWHIFFNIIWVSRAYSGELPPAVFMTARLIGDVFGMLPAYRVLMVWVYARTESLLIAILMHAGLTAATIIVEPAGISGISLVIYDAAAALAMWALAAAVVAGSRRQAIAPAAPAYPN